MGEKKLINEAIVAQLWQVYATQAFVPAVVEAVKRGFLPDIANAIPADKVAAKFWIELLERAFDTGMQRGADVAINSLEQAHADAIHRNGGDLAGDLLSVLKNNHANKVARAVIGNITCGQLLSILKSPHTCTIFDECPDCGLYTCVACGESTQPPDAPETYVVRTGPVKCGCVELRDARQDEVH